MLAFSGKKTGRVPDAKRVVNDSNTKSIWWDNVKPISPQLFSWYQKYAQNILTNEKHYNEAIKIFKKNDPKKRPELPI